MPQMRLIISLLFLLGSHALSAAGESTCGGAVFSKGLLWEISQSGIRRGYLFGTIHLEDRIITTLPNIVDKSLLASRHYAMEVELHPLAMRTYAERSRLNAGSSLDQFLSRQEFKDLAQLVSSRYALDETILRQLKPWAVFTLLSRPPPNSGRFQDLVLAELAQKAQLDTTGLETMDELLDELDSLSLEDQLAILRDALKNYPDLEQQRAVLREKYLQQDLAGMAAVNRGGHTDELLFRRLMDHLLYHRSSRMLDRIQPLLRKGDVFIAVGALHLEGQQGLLCGLVTRGYQLNRLY